MDDAVLEAAILPTADPSVAGRRPDAPPLAAEWPTAGRSYGAPIEAPRWQARGQLRPHDVPDHGAFATTCATTPDPLAEHRRLGEGIIATLSDELHGQLAHDIVVEIVQGVLDEGPEDEGRQGLRGRALDSSIVQARARLERLIRARSPE